MIDKENVMEIWQNSRSNDPAIYSDDDAVKLLVSEILKEYWRYCKDPGKRKRKATEKEQANYERHLTNIVLDLNSSWTTDKTQYVGYSRGKEAFVKNGRYWDHTNNHPLLSERVYIGLIDFLGMFDYVENHPAEAGYNPYSSRMRATEKLIQLIDPEVVNWATIRRNFSANAIIVKDEKKKVVPKPEIGDFDLDKANADLQCINANLERSFVNLNVTDEVYELIRKRMGARHLQFEGDDEQEARPRSIDFSNRSLRRIFAMSSFEYGGRFYGGWWQGVPSEYRRWIEIDGVLTSEIDYSTMHVAMLYAEANAELPDRDAYTPEGWDGNLRPVVKKAFMQLINGKKAMRNPNKWRLYAPDLLPEPLPDDWYAVSNHTREDYQRQAFLDQTGKPYTQLLQDVKDLHAPIDHFFFSQAWGWIQRKDADIAEKVMLKLLDEGHTALPVHDSFIVPMKAERRLREVMQESYEEVMGAPCRVETEEAVHHHPPDFDPAENLMDAEELDDHVREQRIKRSGYHKRIDEWQAVQKNR